MLDHSRFDKKPEQRNASQSLHYANDKRAYELQQS